MTADWFRHDSGARRDPKLQTLRKVRDRAAIADYWMLIEILTEQKDHRIRRKFFPGIAAELGIETDELDSLVTTLIDLELFSGDADAIWSESHLRRMEALEAKKENYRKGAHKRIRAVTESSEDSPKILPEFSEDSAETSQSASNLIRSNQISSDLDPDLDLKKETVTVAVPIPEPGLTAPWRDCPLVLLSAANIEDTQMRAKSQGLDPDLHGPDLPNAAIRAQRHLEEHPRDKRIFSALVGFGFTEALKTKHAREGPRRDGPGKKSNFEKNMELLEREERGTR